VEAQLQELVALEKENELLKLNLNEQYRTIAAHDDRERKLKEEVHRLNVTLNELAAEINAERTSRKQLLREQEGNKAELARGVDGLREELRRTEGERDRVKAEL
jgi:chromosome segregation ATPase